MAMTGTASTRATNQQELSNPTDETSTQPKKRQQVYKYAELILEENFWEQGEAQSLFDPKHLYNSVLEAIDNLIKILGECNQYSEGWRNHVVGGGDPKDQMKPYNVFLV